MILGMYVLVKGTPLTEVADTAIFVSLTKATQKVATEDYEKFELITRGFYMVKMFQAAYKQISSEFFSFSAKC